MISVEYLAVMSNKAMEKTIVEVIKKQCRKEREENKVRESVTYFTVDEWAF